LFGYPEVVNLTVNDAKPTAQPDGASVIEKARPDRDGAIAIAATGRLAGIQVVSG
jgi:hypothetical protein